MIVDDLIRLLKIIAFFIGNLAVCQFGNKLNNKYVKWFVSIILILAMNIYIFESTPTGSTFMNYFMLAVVMISTTFILNFIPFNVIDYAVMFSLFIFTNRYCFYYPTSQIAINASVILIIFLSVSKIRLKSLKGHIFHIWLNFIIVFIEGIFIEYLFENVVRQIGFMYTSPLIKLIIWSISATFFIVTNILIIHIIKFWCSDYFREINAMGKKYHPIERHFITISLGILLFFIVLSYTYNTKFDYDPNVQQLFTTACILCLSIQLLFLTQMFRLSYLRENLLNKEFENKSLMTYYSDLETNFSEIENIKHDVKNLFFTMGKYIERSEDSELKDFYYNKIYPFAAGEIQKNDLYSKLLVIDNEQLRAFLYYKFSQAFELGVSVSFDIQLKTKHFSIDMEFIDFIRILGILIDNSIEECILLPKTENRVIIQIIQNQNMTSIKIQNNVSEDKFNTGIKSGVSTKGSDRGLGLKILNDILLKYDFITLNSYFQNKEFIQNILIYKI